MKLPGRDLFTFPKKLRWAWRILIFLSLLTPFISLTGLGKWVLFGIGIYIFLISFSTYRYFAQNQTHTITVSIPGEVAGELERIVEVDNIRIILERLQEEKENG